jgi:hypothetical protein
MAGIIGKYIGVLFAEEDVRAIDQYRRDQETILPVSQTVRQLVRLGIEHSKQADRLARRRRTHDGV